LLCFTLLRNLDQVASCSGVTIQLKHSITNFLTNTYDDNTVQLDINSDTRTRGHTKKLLVRRCRYDVRKYSFSIRITNIGLRNSLPDEIISAPTVNTFKNRLDRFWAEQEVFYSYKANITGNKGVNL